MFNSDSNLSSNYLYKRWSVNEVSAKERQINADNNAAEKIKKTTARNLFNQPHNQSSRPQLI
ncbi:MAG: hypothetical protein ACK48W_03640 [Bacteroidota bacterium]